MNKKTETIFDPELCKCLMILEIKFSCYFKFPKGKRKYYVSIKKNINAYKDGNIYRFPVYNPTYRSYRDCITWQIDGRAKFFSNTYGYSKEAILYLSWDAISL